MVTDVKDATSCNMSKPAPGDGKNADDCGDDEARQALYLRTVWILKERLGEGWTEMSSAQKDELVRACPVDWQIQQELPEHASPTKAAPNQSDRITLSLKKKVYHAEIAGDTPPCLKGGAHATIIGITTLPEFALNSSTFFAVSSAAAPDAAILSDVAAYIKRKSKGRSTKKGAVCEVNKDTRFTIVLVDDVPHQLLPSALPPQTEMLVYSPSNHVQGQMRRAANPETTPMQKIKIEQGHGTPSVLPPGIVPPGLVIDNDHTQGPVADAAQPISWCYRDSFGGTQGPFSTSQMCSWFEDGSFAPNTLCTPASAAFSCDAVWKTMSSFSGHRWKTPAIMITPTSSLTMVSSRSAKASLPPSISPHRVNRSVPRAIQHVQQPPNAMTWRDVDGPPAELTLPQVKVTAGPLDVHETENAIKIIMPSSSTKNYVGRILGPRGATLKAVQAETGCMVCIRGRGSIRNEEEEERRRGTFGNEHLEEPLHVLVRGLSCR
jgi:hypothetical protein